jgi:hypothetical protein
VALNRFRTLDCLENAMETIVLTMADCEFYERIYASSKLPSQQVLLRSPETTERFRQEVDSALLELYAAVSVFMVRVKLYFEKPSFMGALKPFTVEFGPLLEGIRTREGILRKLADQASMDGIRGMLKPNMLQLSTPVGYCKTN